LVVGSSGDQRVAVLKRRKGVLRLTAPESITVGELRIEKQQSWKKKRKKRFPSCKRFVLSLTCQRLTLDLAVNIVCMPQAQSTALRYFVPTTNSQRLPMLLLTQTAFNSLVLPFQERGEGF